MYQHPLFDLEETFDKPLKKYELFFSVVDLSKSVWNQPCVAASCVLQVLSV